ncbi:Hypothetical protein LUCI_4654 [Lucifera butyrica]|uniref:DUF3592 domain-containing protein n=1 Tax=Lucifera butyrica TaxID=1351585 RepID=A0A498RCU4_9FIRM|nr:hypothetical protein [Lucifera butyrica]VBB09364.1 Hypothetical protein LUCI_4654 [Lucifera butyrica]
MSDLVDLLGWIGLPLIITIGTIYYVFRSVTRNSRMMKKLVSAGVVAPARIDNLEQTGTMINNNPVLRIWVTAYPQNQPPVQLEIKQLVSLISIPQVGSQVVVAYDPQKPQEAIILSKEYTDQLKNGNGLAGNTSNSNLPFRPVIPNTNFGRRIFLRMVLFLIGMAAIFAFAWKDQLVNEAYKFLPETATSLRGQWVGTMELDKSSNDPAKKPEKAVIHINFHMKQAFLGWYDGDGEMLIQGENKPHHIKLSMVEERDDGRISGSSDSGGIDFFEAKKKDGTINLKLKGSDNQDLTGVLHKGNDAEYQVLCKNLRAGTLK